ncbi:hypothetical protein [Thermostaphylospora chromogena]|uniref:Uncharacterized protein n=1 Tax=Thermostaphylospora chromogena TaxID=35622 RepID=A0A1H1GE50_9ACTN|nr:hypothetical protein [Thermostaphylospora chromogena]SDR11524.1 hypothetical protein SAMN04489764_3539 [Thermostaphylospora chromogena]
MSRAPARRRRRPARPRPRPSARPRPRPVDGGGRVAFSLSDHQQRLLKVVGTVVGVVAASVVITAVIASLGGGEVAREDVSADIGLPAPSDYRGWASPGLFAPIADRKTDSKPLTVNEVFGSKTLKADKAAVKLVDRRLDDDCAAAAWGELVERLADAGCSQALRGLYVSSDKRHVLQYTLFNLRDVEAANTLVEELSTGHRSGWARVLESRKAVFPGDGYSEGSGHAMGHYAGLVWLARADGGEPRPGDDFVALSLAVRGAEKAVYRRVVTVTGTGGESAQ